MERKELKVSVPVIKPDSNWTGWDEETFHLREHLHDLINSYGLDTLRQELNECEWLIDKKNKTKNA